MRRAEMNLDDLKKIHKEVADAVLPFAIYNAPKLSGALLSTIRASGTNSAAYIRVGNKRAPYGGFQEYGYPAGFHDSRGQARSYAPHPWLRDAVHDSEKFWAHIYFEGIDNILDKIHGD